MFVFLCLFIGFVQCSFVVLWYLLIEAWCKVICKTYTVDILENQPKMRTHHTLQSIAQMELLYFCLFMPQPIELTMNRFKEMHAPYTRAVAPFQCAVP